MPPMGDERQLCVEFVNGRTWPISDAFYGPDPTLSGQPLKTKADVQRYFQAA